MDIKILIITIILLAAAFAGLLIKVLSRPGGEFPRSSCSGYGKDAMEGDEKCAVCDLKNTDKCPSDISHT
ncbi:MAG TPA: hypothetical protein VFC67_24675 [Prolixibacteraceae bacterium]|nr:hypothetical protein [Prolixibacteraceae bacterium]